MSAGDDPEVAQRRIKRRRLLQWVACASGAGVTAGAGWVLAQPAPRVIEMTARRFEFEPKEIALKTGEKVVLAITSLDFVHGFNIPDLNTRLDLVPGRINRLELQPMKAGIIEFVCDNFCGDKHEEMHGSFIVS